MAIYNASNTELNVYAFKAGLLSKIAHDLKLKFEHFQIDFDQDNFSIEASVDPASIAVVCCMKKGVEARGALSAADKKKILEYTYKDVLHSKRHTSISFRSSSVDKAGKGYTVQGTLSLHGVGRHIAARVTRAGDKLTTRFDINQPDYGIKPFSAMLGALKIKPVVTVEITVPVSSPA